MPCSCGNILCCPLGCGGYGARSVQGSRLSPFTVIIYASLSGRRVEGSGERWLLTDTSTNCPINGLLVWFFFIRFEVWALCPSGYYLSGIHTSGIQFLNQTEEAKCCRPPNHPNAYEDCYDEDVGLSFDEEGWSVCKQYGYYMAGFYKSDCEKLYCIERFRCCKMLWRRISSKTVARANV